MGITTKTLVIDEWREWRWLRLDALADAPGAFGSALADWSDATDERWQARIRDVPLNVIALLDGEPVGQVSGMEANLAGSVVLISMWVAPAARGAGVGDALIGAVIGGVASHEATRVELDVNESNLPARRLYERNQFAVGRTEGAADKVRMVRTLAGGPRSD